MKLKLIALAAALAAAGSAHALTPADIVAARGAGTLKEITVAGASAIRLSFAAYIQEICEPTTFDVFFNSGATPGNNHRAYSCNLKTAVGNFPVGTPLLVNKRDQSGSTAGVNPIATATAQAHMTVDATCVATANPSPTPDIQLATFLCPNTANALTDGGLSDVEPALLQQTINLPSGTLALTSAQLGTLDIAPLAQALFGVVVNKKAYRALQEAQGLIGAGGALDEDPAKQPTLPSQFVRSALITGGLAPGATNKRGWNVVIPTSVDALSETKTVNICRRAEGSGTQAASNIFFANNPCGSGTASLSVIGVAGSSGSTPAPTVTGTITVAELTSTGNLESCIGTAVEAAVGADNTAYGLAVIGRENNPLANGGDKGYRYVKLDGVAPIRDEAKIGRYPFWYENTMQWNTATVPPGSDKDAFLRSIRSNAGRSSSLANADADTQQSFMASPSTYSGAYANLATTAELSFASRVARGALNSCSPARIVR